MNPLMTMDRNSSSEIPNKSWTARNKVVRSEFPKVAYLLSDIVVMIHTDPFFVTKYGAIIEEFSTKARRKIINQTSLPALILICNRRGHQELADKYFEVANATHEFREAQDRKYLKAIDQSFRSLDCIYFCAVNPHDNGLSKQLYDQQLERFKQVLHTRVLRGLGGAASGLSANMPEPPQWFQDHQSKEELQAMVLRAGKRYGGLEESVLLKICKDFHIQRDQAKDLAQKLGYGGGDDGVEEKASGGAESDRPHVQKEQPWLDTKLGAIIDAIANEETVNMHTIETIATQSLHGILNRLIGLDPSVFREKVRGIAAENSFVSSSERECVFER